MSDDKKNTGLIKKLLTVIAVVIVVGGGFVLYGLGGSDSQVGTNDASVFTVVRGPLRINVIEAGSIKAREQVTIKSEVEGRTTILSLVPEGTIAKKGDLLVELDATSMVDDKIDQEIRVQNADASFVQARENLAVTENQAQSDIDKAELTLEFAGQDLEKYKKGEYPNQLKEAQARITLAEEELQRAVEDLEWSRKLYEEEYISKSELQADELAANKKKLDVELAKNDLELLKNFTYKREMAELKSDLSQAEMALERTKRKASADVVQAKATLLARESEYNRQKDRLEKIKEQISKAKIYAPAGGLVIYATSAKGNWRGNAEPLEEGREVREREELIFLPTALTMKAEIKIHESSMKKVKLGQPATITTEALPGKVFSGSVSKIAPLPDAQSAWMNPDLKVYNTEINLDGEDANLRTGMSCKAEIIIAEYEDALYVPVQCVVRVGGQRSVYVKTSGGIEPRAVETGLDNNRMIHILSGLQAGEKVLMAPPLASGELEQGRVDMDEDTDSTVEKSPSAEKNVEQQRERPAGMPGMKQFENMTPEQRDALRKQFENMTPEQKEALLKRMSSDGSRSRRRRGDRNKESRQDTAE